MNKFMKRLAVAVMTCAAAGAAACKEQAKQEDKPTASTSAPAMQATAEKASEPAAVEAKPEAAATPAPAAAPEKVAEASPAPAAAPAPAAEPEKTAEAPAAAEQKVAEADAVPNPDAPNAPPPGSRKKDGDAVYPNPVSELAKKEGYKFEDGRYRDKDGNPQYVVTKDYMVDWGTWNGFRRYHDACHVCHGPNALGSSFAPALADSLKTMDYGTFLATVAGGRQVNRAGTEYVMPSFGDDKNIMCYIDDIYTYIKARSTGAMPPGRPNGREDISPDAKKAADDCTG